MEIMVLLQLLLLFVLRVAAAAQGGGIVVLNSRIYAQKKNDTWLSSNATFALGFHPISHKQYVLAIWYAGIANATLVWMANRDQPVGENGVFMLGPDGNLQLVEGQTTIWMGETTGLFVESGEMLDSGNFVLYNSARNVVWQSFASPTDTLLPGQPLTESLNLSSWNSSWDTSRGPYSLKFKPTTTTTTNSRSQPESDAGTVQLLLNYNAPLEEDELFNYSYWLGPEIQRKGGPTVAYLDSAGNFVMRYGPTNTTRYIYENRNIGAGSAVLWRLTLQSDGNLRLLRWDDDFQDWVPEWIAVSNPCTIVGICGNGICSINGTGSSQPSCSQALPWSETSVSLCASSSSSSSAVEEIRSRILEQTSYFGGSSSIVVNLSNVGSESECFSLCSRNCSCVAAVYGGINVATRFCATFKNLVFGGLWDSNYSMFLKMKISHAPHSGTQQQNKNKEKMTIIIILAALLVSVVIVVSSASVFCLLFNSSSSSSRGKIFLIRKSKRRRLDASIFVPGAPVKFSVADLQTATNNFREKVGAGGFGTVYKGTLSDDTLIAVKKLERALPHGEKEFKTEVSTIGAIHHRNLVRLCGFCSEGIHRLLVYEYLQNGSLDRWLFVNSGAGGGGGSNNQSRVLDWDTRYNIALGTAQGIAYFHEQCRDRIIHCDIKPENILLDDNFCSKVSDFGLAKLMGREHSHVTTMVRGTRGYLAPEWITNRPITVKADVYSYGMVLLEIIGGRRNLDLSLGSHNFFFPGWAFQEMMKGNALKVVDKRLFGGEVNEDELVRALRVAFWCIQDDVALRPYMGLVVKILEGSLAISDPPMPQSVLDMMDEGLPNVYSSMKKHLASSSAFSHCCSSSTRTSPDMHMQTDLEMDMDGLTSIARLASDATFDYSSMSIAR